MLLRRFFDFELDPVTAAATEQNLNNTEQCQVREFVADATSKAMQTFCPALGPQALVAVVEGYSGLIRMLLLPRDEQYNDRCHTVICEGISSVYDFCGYNTGTRLLSTFGEVILQCLNGPNPLACHVETLQRCLVSLAPKHVTSGTLTSEEVGKLRDVQTNMQHNSAQYGGRTPPSKNNGNNGNNGNNNDSNGNNNNSNSNSGVVGSSPIVSSVLQLSQGDQEIFQQQLAAIVTSCVESALKFLYGCGSLNQHPDLVASMFILLRDTCRHITGLFVNMWQNGPIVEFTTAGLTMQKRECGRAVLGFIEVLTTCGCLDATSGPIVLHGMLGAAAGSMPSFMLEPISDSMQFMIKAIGRDTMGMWLTQAVAPDGFPSKSMKEKTKTKFVQDFTQADNRSKYKRILKAFCGGKRKGEQGVGFKNKVKKSNKNRNKQ